MSAKLVRKKRIGAEGIVLITAPSAEEARKIANALVSEHLVACVNIVCPIQSIYFWQSKVCDEQEALLICKTRMDLFDRISRRVKDLHSYTVPEIIALPIAKGSADYLRWIHEVTQAKSQPG